MLVWIIVGSLGAKAAFQFDVFTSTANVYSQLQPFTGYGYRLKGLLGDESLSAFASYAAISFVSQTEEHFEGEIVHNLGITLTTLGLRYKLFTESSIEIYGVQAIPQVNSILTYDVDGTEETQASPFNSKEPGYGIALVGPMTETIDYSLELFTLNRTFTPVFVAGIGYGF
jgi:hypothetical protein